jgi:putative DNA primase/helicase
MQSVYDYAQFYARRGFRLLPLHRPLSSSDGKLRCSCGKAECTSPGKHPVGSLVPRGLKQASADPGTIEQWFSGRERNIGIATGTTSGIVVLDIDPRHEGDETLAALEKRHGPLPPTWRFLTGGGGEHIIFRHPGGMVPNSAGRIAKGIDVRGDGGYIVAPPSLHISGRAYAISVDHDPETVPLADIPSWLLPLLKEKADRPVKAIPAEEWRQGYGQAVSEGQRNNVVAKLAGHLLRNRVDPWLAAELLTGWNIARCQPPLAETEILATIRSIARREIQRRNKSGGSYASG